MEGEDLKSVFKIGQPHGSPAVGVSKSASEPPVDMHEGVAKKIKEVSVSQFRSPMFCPC